MPGLFDEAKHPRDPHGEFAHVASSAHRDVAAGVSGFVPEPGQTHARCRVDGAEHELNKFPTMAGGRRGTECRTHRDARREALKRGETPPTPTPTPPPTLPEKIPVKPQPGQRRKKPTAAELGITPRPPEDPLPPITGMGRTVLPDRDGNEVWVGAQVRLASGSGGVPWVVTGVYPNGNLNVSRPHNRTGNYSGTIDKSVRAADVALHTASPYARPPQGEGEHVSDAEASELARQHMERLHGVKLPPVGTRVRGVDLRSGEPIEGRVRSYQHTADGSRVSLLKDGELGDRGHVEGWTHPKDVTPVESPTKAEEIPAGLPSPGETETIKHDPPHPFHGSTEVRHNAGAVRMRDDVGDGSRMGRFTAPLRAGSVHFTLDGEQHGVILHPVVSRATDETYTAEKAPNMHWNLADGVSVHREVEGRGKTARARYTVLDTRNRRAEPEKPPAPTPPPRDMSAQAVSQRINDRLRDSGNDEIGADASWFDREELHEALRTQPGASVMLKPSSGYETNLDRRDVEALLRHKGGTPPRPEEMVRESRTDDGYHITEDPEIGVSVSTPFVPGEPPLFPILKDRAEADAWIAAHRARTGRGKKDLGITSGPTGGPGVGTFSGGTVTVPAFSVIQRDAPPSSPGAETALRSLRRQHNAVHGDDDQRRARIDPLRRVYARGYRKAKGTGRGQAALDRVRQHLNALSGSSSGPDPDLLPESHPGHVARGSKSVVDFAIARGAFVDGLPVGESKSLFGETYRYGGGSDGFDPSALVEYAATATAEAKRLRDETLAYAEALRARPPLADRLSTKTITVDTPRARVSERKADAVLGSVAPPGQAPRLLYQSGTDDPALTWASSPDVPPDVSLDRKTGGLTLDISDDLVVALVSVTGVVDEVDDLPEPGVYAETLRLRIPKGIWSHDWDVWVSRTEAIEELMPGDSRLPTTTRLGDPWPRDAGGLLVATRFNTGTQPGREALSNVRFFDEGPLGPQTEWSVGYNVRPGKAFRRRDGVRVIRSWDCFEYGPVLFGAASLSGTLQLAGTKASAMRQERRVRL